MFDLHKPPVLTSHEDNLERAPLLKNRSRLVSYVTQNANEDGLLPTRHFVIVQSLSTPENYIISIARFFRLVFLPLLH